MNKVLVVDDDPGVHSIIHAIIKEKMSDCYFISAFNGLDGIKAALDEQPDAILLDVGMPGIDGFEVCRRLKSDKRTLHIPIIVFSGMVTDKQSMNTLKEYGAETVITKPLRKDDLISVFKTVLSRKGNKSK